MAKRPDYGRLRAQRGFAWSVSATYLALLDASEVPIRDFYTDPEAGIEVFRRGRRAIRDLYGEELELPQLMTPPVSYGHVNALGLELSFPDGGEVNYHRDPRSLEAWCEVLTRPVDWEQAGRLPFYAHYQKRMEEAFPGESARLSWGVEGPMTTAYELRDMEVFTDVVDTPVLFTRFLDLLTRSSVDFLHFMARRRGEPEVSPVSAGMADDVASMFSPAQWESHVLDAWETYYAGLTTGDRVLHVEDLRPDHLVFLERAAIWSYDPSISAKLDPKTIAQRTRVPFAWRLANFHYPALSQTDVRDWVFQAAADGASRVFTLVCGQMVTPEARGKVEVFRDTCRVVEHMLAGGATRSDIARCVTPQGRKRFWSEWP